MVREDFQNVDLTSLALSPTLKMVEEMHPLEDDESFNKTLLSDDKKMVEGMIFSEQTVLRQLKEMIRELYSQAKALKIMEILNRDSMKGSPLREPFRQALQELAEQAGYKI